MMAGTDFVTQTIAMILPDPLDDALDDLRISGSVLLHRAYSPPWAVDVPAEPRLRDVMGVGADMRVLPFHLVRRGGFELSRDGAAVDRVVAPDLLLLPGGMPHRLSDGRGAIPMPLERILAMADSASAPEPVTGTTELICGAFVLRAAPLNPLLGALPAALKAETDGANANPALVGAVNLLAAECGRRARNGFTAQRLLEVLCAEAIRSFQAARGGASSNWFSGLADPKIGVALREIHAAPGAEWSVERLAALVALSPSRFAARFRDIVGESVMDYIGRWRANVACRLLRETDLALDKVALRIGYASTPAFSRAFKARLGLPPAQWRRTRESAIRDAS
jgi:AraC-like DNA-binding protein